MSAEPRRAPAELPLDGRWFWSVAAVLTLLSALPVLLAWLRTPPGYLYSGYLVGKDDYFSYLEKIREGFQGAWLYVNRYSLEGHRPAFIFSFYLAVGHLCRLLHLPLWAGYHLSRLVLLPLALRAVWAFLGTQLKELWQRRWALLLTFGLSGFGVLAADGSLYGKLELHLGEHLYLAAFYPHYLLDGIALCWGFVLFLRWLRAPAFRHWVAGAACLWLLALIHPFLVLPALGVPGVYTLLWRRDLLQRALTWGVAQALVVAPVMAYMFWALYRDAGLAAWRAQAIARPFAWWAQLLWFGFAGPFAVYGAWRALRRQGAAGATVSSGAPAVGLAVVWIGLDVLLINTRLIANALEFALFMGTPVAALTVLGLTPLRERWRSGVGAGLLKAALVLGMGFSCLVILLSASMAPLVGDADLRSRFYLSPGLAGAYSYLAEHSGPQTVALASFTAANQLPGYFPGRVYMGHAVETLAFQGKYDQAGALYTGTMAPAAAQQFLQEQGVEFVLEDHYSTFDMHNGNPPWVSGLSRYPFLQPVWQSPDATVFRLAN